MTHPLCDTDVNLQLDNLRLKKDTEEALRHVFQGAANHVAELGFEFCAFYVRFPVPVSRPVVAAFDNHPAAWSARYREENYLAVDPTFKHARHYQSSQIWSARVFAEAPELWRELQANGLNAGWAFPARNGKGIVGMLSVARSCEQISPDEARDKQSRLNWIAHTTHLAITRQLAPLAMPAYDANLTNREIDILRWTAEGKTAHEISRILSISERTVNFHANNAVAKLHVANKTAAVAHAALLGIL